MHFEKKNPLHILNILEVIAPRNVVTSMPESSGFRIPIQSQGVHESQTAPKPTEALLSKFPIDLGEKKCSYFNSRKLLF